MIRRIRKILLLIVLFICLYPIVLFGWFVAVTDSDHYDVRDQADAVVILMGEVNDEFTDIGRQTIRRVNHGYELYRSGQVDKILCVGGSRPSRSFSGAALMKQRLVNKGVPASDIFLEPKSYDTRTNMQFASEIARQQGWTSVIIVSSPLHLYRIQRMPALGHWMEIEIYLSGFRYEQAVPSITWIEKIRHAHYEWMSYAVNALPDHLYQKLVRHLREQSS